MKISLTKHESRPHTLLCLRDDGSRTWFTSANNSGYFVEHDIAHYVVESELGLSDSFYGMVSMGRDLNDFGNPESGPISVEAENTEHLVALLQHDRRTPVSYGEYVDALSSMCKADCPAVTESDFQNMRANLARLMDAWRGLKPEEVLEVEF